VVVREAEEIFARVLGEGRKFLLEPEAKEVCGLFGIPVTRFRVARSVEEAVGFAREIGFPVVLKVVSPDVLHKFDVGGVVLDVKSEGEVRVAYDRVLGNVRRHKPGARILGVLVQEMAPASTEVIVGAVKDPQFGPALMFGLGGVFVEVLEDVSFRIAPVSEVEAREMIREVRAYPVLRGYRGMPAVDVDAIVDVLLGVSRLVVEHSVVRELDLNPVMVYERGAKVVDARIVLE
jgi:acetyl-CoA synthetase (ADP-forming)